MSDFTDNEEAGFFQRNRVALIVAGVFVIGATALGVALSKSKGAPARREPMITMVSLPPPPPPPPPPPQLAPPPEQKMTEQPQVMEPAQPDQKPEPPKAPDEPPPLGTGIKGPGGADGYGLGSSGNGGMIGGKGNGSGGGSRWGWYAGQVQTRIADAMRNNRRTRSANVSVQVRVWPDATGRITRASLASSSGDAAIDSAITNEVLNGLQLQEPPPAGMKLPIVLRLVARKPNQTAAY